MCLHVSYTGPYQVSLPSVENFCSGMVFKRLHQNSTKFLRNPIESLLRRLQAMAGQPYQVQAGGAVHTMGPFQGQNI
jgi:hypothetical protein